MEENSILTKGVIPVAFIPSVNAMYERGKRSVKLTPEYRALKSEMIKNLSNGPGANDIIGKIPLQVTIGYYIQGAGVGRRDVDNMNKLFIDALAQYYKFNDNQIYDLYSYKREIRGAPSAFIYYKVEKHPKSKFSFIWSELVSVFNNMFKSSN